MRSLALASLSIFVCVACSSHPSFGEHDSGPSPLGDGSVTYEDGGPPPACGSWIVRGLSAGPDGVLGNGDDVESGYSRMDFDAQGRVSKDSTFSGPGADAKWETADDDITSLQRLVIASPTEGNALTSTGPGADGVWGTSDDVVGARVWFQFDGQGRRVVEHEFSGAGNDGVWGTPDDVIERWYRVTYGVRGSLYQELQFTDPGPDQLPDTSDDPAAILTTRFHDRGTFADNAGPDGTWGTSDDHLDGRYTYDFASSGAITRATLYDTPGPDGVWGTSDDVIGGLVKLSCSGNALGELLMAPGPDGVLGTSDDVVQAHVVVVGCDASVCSSSELPAVGVQPN